MDYIELFNNIDADRIVNNDNLKKFLLSTTQKRDKSDVEVSGYSIKNAIETFLSYVSFISGREKKAFYFTKGNLNDVMNELGFDVETLTSGAYDKELFKVKDFDIEFFNLKLIEFLSAIAKHEERSLHDLNINPISKTYVPLYTVFKQVNKNLETKQATLLKIFSILNGPEIINSLKVKDDAILFSYYNALDLYESWYISQIEIKEDAAKKIIELIA